MDIGHRKKTLCPFSTKLLYMAFLLSYICFPADASAGDIKRKQLFDDGWKFCLGEHLEASSGNYNDTGWRNIDLPHDWSIEGRITPESPAGNDGGYFPTGTGWYRKKFNLSSDYLGKKVRIYFEGVYMNAEVFINGHSLGKQPYGYSSFHYDLTPHLNYGGENIIAVHVDNLQQKNCRWYSGSGIYRHVWLLTTAPVHVNHWGVAVTTPEVSRAGAKVQVSAMLNNETSLSKRIRLAVSLLKEGATVAQGDTLIELPAGCSKEVIQLLQVVNPKLWSTETPELYEAQLVLGDGDTVLDTATETFGIRSIEYSAEKGFLLNGKSLVLNGGCLHHDNGFLGAAAYDRAEWRKAELMKAAGFNAVRTAHNVPSESFLDACDRVGLLVIDESFDGWRDAKNTYDYSVLFDEWWQRDVEAMVLRDRNHPSIFCWSIGNEVIERKKLEVLTTAKKLADYVRKLDASRPVTSALTTWDKDWEIFDPLAAVHDIAGYNYQLHRAAADHERVPERVIMQTESYPRDAYANWERVKNNSYIIGDFVWTAIDYLGESGIGRYYYAGDSKGEHYERNHYPWHGAYCGDIDLTGWRKPISHYREMLYNPDKKLYMAVREPDGFYGSIKETAWSVWPTWESWNWLGYEHKQVEVEVYSRYPKVRLYLNDKLIGEQQTEQFKVVFPVAYEAGTLKAAGIENGVEKETVMLKTSGKAAGIKLTADRTEMTADGQDLIFVTVEVTDKDGNLVPDAGNLLTFNVKGAGSIVAVGNANLRDADPYVGNIRKAWKGRASVVLRSSAKAGKITLRVTSPKLASSVLIVHTKK